MSGTNGVKLSGDLVGEQGFAEFRSRAVHELVDFSASLAHSWFDAVGSVWKGKRCQEPFIGGKKVSGTFFFLSAAR